MQKNKFSATLSLIITLSIPVKGQSEHTIFISEQKIGKTPAEKGLNNSSYYNTAVRLVGKVLGVLLRGRLLLVHLEDGSRTGIGSHLEQRATGCTVHSRLGLYTSLQATGP